MTWAFDISAPVTSLGTGYDVRDLRRIKAALNHLGYYKPARYAGMADERDKEMFVSLKQFQQDHDLQSGDYVMPRDATVQKLNAEMTKIDARERYIWRTAGDERVRDEHAAREGQIFTWGSPPAGGHPGEDYNCRCWVELILDEIQKEKLPPPNIPGTNIPDQGIPEDGVDPNKKSGEEFIDPDMEKKPPLVDPRMPTTIFIPDFYFRWRR